MWPMSWNEAARARVTDMTGQREVVQRRLCYYFNWASDVAANSAGVQSRWLRQCDWSFVPR